MHCSVLPTFGCDMLIPPCPKQVFPQSGPAYNVFTNINSYSTTHTPRSGQENTKCIAFFYNILFVEFTHQQMHFFI